MLEIWTGDEPRIETDEESRALIEAAQAGDEAATVRLIRAHRPTMRKMLAEYGRVGVIDDDARAIVVLAALEAIAEHDLGASPRVGGNIIQRVRRALSEDAARRHGKVVPIRTLERFWAIVRLAEGDMLLAERLAPEHHMTRESFRTVQAALHGRSFEDVSDYGDAPVMDENAIAELERVEDAETVKVAFDSVEGVHADVVYLAYGFADRDSGIPNPDMVNDAEVGYRMGGHSRQWAMRRRNEALALMRSAILPA